MSIDRDDLEELLAVFNEEAGEHVDDLNDAILALEQGEVGRLEVVADAFRAAHSLKGMSAALGFVATARVTHALEAVLDMVREAASHGEDVLDNGAVIGLLLEAADKIASVVRQIAETGVEPTDASNETAALCERLEAAAVKIAGQTAAITGSADGADSAVAVDYSILEAAQSAGFVIWELDIAVADSALMPAARAYASMIALSGEGDLLASDPPREHLESGAHEGQRIKVWMAVSAHTSANDLEAAASVREIETVQVKAWSGVPEADRASDSPLDGSSAEAQPTSGRGGASGTDRSGEILRRTVRVDASRLDELMHGVGELLVRRAKLQNLVTSRADQELIDAVDGLDRAARELQELVMDVRMVSIDQVLRRIPRVVRDVANDLGKDIRLTITGRDTELDRTVMDVIGDPLVHLVRNAIDHGIEDPEERERLGKPRTGLLAISATTEGGSVAIRVRDDGGGMRPDIIRESAIRKGVIDAARAATLTDEEALDLCFAAGFSTRSVATSVSGRGVGLDVVRSSVRALGGDVIAESSDEGTVMTIRLPLTLAIRSTLQVSVDGETYAFHTDRVGQTVELDLADIQSVTGRPALVHLGRIVPLVDLSQRLHGTPWRGTQGRKAVIVEAGAGEAIAVVVDDVVGQSEVVTRPLPSTVEASGLLGASAILGDGNIAFVIDAVQLTGGVEFATLQSAASDGWEPELNVAA